MSRAAKPDAAQDHDEMTVTPFPILDPGDIASESARNLDYATRAARACLGGAAQLGWEAVGFFNMRFAKDIARAKNFMTAKTSHEAYHEQALFIEEALRDYADAASKWLHIAADAANHTLTPMEERTEEVLEEFDARGAQGEPAA
ncbi:MAG: phasin family protein [Parvularculaceae bacterium]